RLDGFRFCRVGLRRLRFCHLRLCRFQPGALCFGGVGLRGILGGGVNRGGLRGGGRGLVGGGRRGRGGCYRRRGWRRLRVLGGRRRFLICNRRRSRGGTLPGDGPGDGIEPLFQAGDTGIQPVAIAIERIDGGGKPPRLVVGFFGDHLDLLRLPRQIGGGDLFLLQSERRLVGHHGQNHRSGRAGAPGSDPPQRAAVEIVFLGQQVAQHATGVIRLEVR